MSLEVEQVATPAARAAAVAGAPEIKAVPVCIGFTAVVAQIVLMRELVVVFCGNEISLGLILATWLLWTAIGGSLFARLRLPASPRVAAAVLQLAAGLSFPLTIALVRSARLAFRLTPGELLGPAAMFLICVAVLAAFCALSGWLFAQASRLYADEYKASNATASGTVYLLEALGSCAGGLLASLVLLRYCTAVQIAVLALAVNAICAACVLLRGRHTRLLAAAILVAFFGGLLSLAALLDSWSQTRLWRGLHLVSSIDSVYGRLDVVETPATRSMYENGLVAFHAADPENAEDAVHFALLQHPEPHSLLLIGGGLDGSLAQALQHASIDRLDYVELDPTIVLLAGRYFPAEATALRSPRVRVHHVDGRLFVKTTASTFDVIIVNLPDPQTAQLNRFYTRELFSEAASRLNPGGVLSFRVRGAENYISPEQAEFLRCLDRTLRAVFPEVKAIPGDTIHFSAANRAGMLTADPEILLGRLRQRHLETRYVREYFLPFRLSPDRTRDLERELQPRHNTPMNTDLSPTAYYFAATMWSTSFGTQYRDLFFWLAGVRFWRVLLLAVIVVAAIAGITLRFARNPLRASASLCVAATGLVLMGLEVLLLLGFQAIYGFVYYQLAIVIGAFMAGMAGGSWLVLRHRNRDASVSASTYAFAGLQAAAAISPLLVYAMLRLLTAASVTAPLLVISEVLFPMAALVFGAVGGAQFQVASRIYFSAAHRPANLATLYAFDLLGAFAGAIAVSAYLVPVFGMFECAVIISAVALVPLLAVLPASTPASRRA